LKRGLKRLFDISSHALTPLPAVCKRDIQAHSTLLETNRVHVTLLAPSPLRRLSRTPFHPDGPKACVNIADFGQCLATKRLFRASLTNQKPVSCAVNFSLHLQAQSTGSRSSWQEADTAQGRNVSHKRSHSASYKSCGCSELDHSPGFTTGRHLHLPALSSTPSLNDIKELLVH
jgi:hypothetical protein